MQSACKETMSYFHFKSRITNTITELRWIRFWMRFAGLSPFGRIATWLASIPASPHKARVYLAKMNPQGYISTKAVIHHADFQYGKHIFVDDRVVLFQREQGGAMIFGDRVFIYRDTILETGYGGSLTIDDEASIHPRCQINAYVSDIYIGKGVMLAPGCALYPYDHGTDRNTVIREQPLTSKGSIDIGEEAWLSFGAIVLGGVRIGAGAVIGAGAIVTEEIPDYAIAVGRPAKVVGYRK
jgi:acetyltransferase-like isoleucine patch superfamily enzyme